jgi:hypothetical protein
MHFKRAACMVPPETGVNIKVHVTVTAIKALRVHTPVCVPGQECRVQKYNFGNPKQAPPPHFPPLAHPCPRQRQMQLQLQLRLWRRD